MTFMDEEENEDLKAYLGALGSMHEPSETAVRGTEDGAPPFSIMFDPDNAPDDALAWLAQFVGVELEKKNVNEDDFYYFLRQRQRIKDHLGFARGSAAAMRATAALYLTGGRQVIFRERDGSAYHLTIVTRTAETPDAARVERELLKIKPAGLTLDYHTITGTDWAEVATTYASWDALVAARATWDAVVTA